MENTYNSINMQKILKKFIFRLKLQRNVFIFGKAIEAMLLSALLVLVFFVFSINIDWYHFKNIHWEINLDTNCIRLLWIIVVLGVVGMVWVIGRFFYQLKRYQSCIIRLRALNLKNSIKTSISNDKINEEEICREVDKIMNEFCFGHNELDCVCGGDPTDGSQQK